MKQIKIGSWKFRKTNKTIQFKSTDYNYEIDCEQGSVKGWLYHIGETKGQVMTRKDRQNLRDIMKEIKVASPDLPIFHNADEDHIARMFLSTDYIDVAPLKEDGE